MRGRCRSGVRRWKALTRRSPVQEQHDHDQARRQGGEEPGEDGLGPVPDVGVGAGQRLGQVVEPVLDLLGHVVAFEGVADDRKVAELAHDLREVLAQRAGLAGRLGAEEQGDERQRQEEAGEDAADGDAPTQPEHLLDAVDQRVHRQREEQADDDPGEGP